MTERSNHRGLHLAVALLACSCSRSSAAPAPDAQEATVLPSASSPFFTGCDPRFPHHVHVEPGQPYPDEPSARALAIDPGQAADAGVRCYAPGPHLAFNGADWCCR